MRRIPATTGKLAWVAAATLLAAACSGGSDDTATTSPVTTPTTRASTAPDTTATSGQSGEGPPAGLAGLEALQQNEPEVVDAAADTRCDRLGYPCSWSDVPESDFERSHQLSLELEELTIDATDPLEGFDAALARLADVDDLAELIIDWEGLTGLMFRLEGMPEMYAFSAYAGPVGEPEEFDLAALGVELVDAEDGDAGVPATSQPQGFRSVPRDYHPTGGPIEPKTALVLDPYALKPTKCPEGTPKDAECRITKDKRVEGSVIHAILDADDQITSTYVPQPDDPSQPGGWDPILGPPLSGFDLVHLATHGSSGCAGLGPGWVVTWGGSDDDEEAEPKEWPDRCYSVSAIGIYNKARYASLPADQRRIPDGLSLSGDKWVARDDYFAGKFKSSAIVYMSHCTSADGSLYRSGRFGSYVGWHSYARITTAGEAGITFWNLMATEGLEFDQAIEELGDRSLTSTVVADLINGGAVGAELASTGKNQRARDVVELKIDGADPDGQVLRVEGMPGDNQPERFPAEQQQVAFEVEGVRNGTAGNVTIEFYHDGKKLKLKRPIKLDGDGTKIKEGKDWGTWRVALDPGLVEIPDTAPADFAPGASPKPLEIRAFVDSSKYTADRGNVTLGALLASNGPIPIFTELAAGMPSNGSLTGNDLRIEFDTAGGEASGFMRVEMAASGLDIGYWQFELDGSYDPAAQRLSGEMSGEAFGSVAGITAGDSGTGTWEGTADLAGKQVVATLGVGGQSQSYIGKITPVVTTG